MSRQLLLMMNVQCWASWKRSLTVKMVGVKEGKNWGAVALRRFFFKDVDGVVPDNLSGGNIWVLPSSNFLAVAMEDA